METTSNMKKLIFLDVDGVLNDQETVRKADWENMPSTTFFSPVLCERVQRIAKTTGALFVISSTWRIMFENRADMREFFGSVGFDPATVIDMTPRGYPGRKFSEHVHRGLEIQHWINKSGMKDDIYSLAIIDDDSDMVHLKHRLVNTETAVGITEKHVATAIELLSSPDPKCAHLAHTFPKGNDD